VLSRFASLNWCAISDLIVSMTPMVCASRGVVVPRAVGDALESDRLHQSVTDHRTAPC
jgi:hypothetical protein